MPSRTSCKTNTRDPSPRRASLMVARDRLTETEIPMTDTVASLKLTCEGAMKRLGAGMAKAEEMRVPQGISIVDAGGHLLAFVRMDGAFSQSVDTSLMKAKTAASYGKPTGDLAAGVDLKLAIATRGRRINLPGGLPIIVEGHVIGIGIGSRARGDGREGAP